MTTHSSSPKLLRGATRLGIALGCTAVLLAGWGILSRVQAQAALNQAAQADGVLPVIVVKPSQGTAGEDLILPGTLQAFTETPIYARTSGYLKRWLVDIGTPVKAGQLLAEIDTPEIDQQTVQAEADLQTAEANNKLAQLTATRYKGLLATDSVSQQDADDKLGDAAAKQAAVASARANLQRLRELEGFKRIVAPVDGVVTARNTDVGDLIDAGGGNSRELFHIAATQRLRVYVQVPESYAGDMHVGSSASLRLREQPTQSYPAQLVSTASAIDPNTHTLLVQLAADNKSGALLPGGYAEVHVSLDKHPDTLRVPANALMFGPAGMQVATVNGSKQVQLLTITPGRDFGKDVEVLGGLKPDQAVIINPPDSLSAGQKVEPQALAASGGK